jgi:hypothetical protein
MSAIVLVLASPEYLRFFDTTIGVLAQRGHRVHLVVNEPAGHKPVGLAGAASLPLASIEVWPWARTFWADTAYRYRAVVDFMRFLHPDFAAAPVLRERIRRKVLPRAFAWLDRIRSVPPAALDAALAALEAGERALPIDPRVVSMLAERQPDLVIVSPLVDAASTQVEWLKAARAAGIPSALAVASWDNLTNKGLMRVAPDRVFVWNDIQRTEARRYHRVPSERIVVTGAPIFDRWFHATPSRPRDEFCATAGVPAARPFVLFTGSSSFIADAEAEVAFVRRWVGALRDCAAPDVRNLAVLVRPHPYNTEAWTAADLRELGGVSVWPRGAFNPASEQGRRDFFDSLHYSQAVVGINTSAMIEAAIVGRPVLTVTDFETQAGTLHFHYLLAEHGGPVEVASTLREHVEQLAEALRDPSDARQRRRRFVESFVRPNGMSADAAPQLAAAIEGAAALRVEAQGAGMAMVLRPAMAAFGAGTAAYDRLTGPDPLAPVRKGLLHPLRSSRKRAARALERGREHALRTGKLAASRMRRSSHVVRAQVRHAPHLWKSCRRAARQVRYNVAVFVKGAVSAGPRKS